MNRRLTYILAAIFVIGAAVRLADVLRPIERSLWRESDVGAVARNFATESLNIFYPRIDWRGTSPGYAEMEFPLYPFIIAVTYKLFGVNDVLGRVWALAFSLLTLLVFFKLAREYLDGPGLVAAAAFFAFNPLIVEFSTSIQPEGLMLLFYLASVLFFVRWIDRERDGDFAWAALFTALALLAKMTAGHIGLLFAFWLLRKHGFGVLSRWRVWIFGAVSLVPAAVWYIHAKGLWKAYGNSLGVSNEYHWIGADFFTNPYFLKGILGSEIFWVWSLGGFIIGSFALIVAFRERAVRDALVWTAACFIFYIIAARTAADDWAAYYHIFSVPPAALLFGAGIRELIRFAGRFADNFSANSGLVNLSKVALMLAFAFVALIVFAVDVRQIRARFLENRVTDPSYVCATRIKPLIAEPGLILASGDRCFDPDGYEVAYNASFMFYWLDRKGFNVCVEEQSVAKVRSIAGDGAKYMVGQRYYMKQKPGFEEALRREFPVVAECDEIVVFDLRK
ncbi:MAG: glycosyltransferase family 39 protein [Acidobacteria bacterium]|nr:glycosyltransferase family 39 protein [Acidobacteriota bacterium]